jgi:predicted O-methyltransferase YrrM
VKWEAGDAVAIQLLAPLSGGYVPWTTWSLKPEALLHIVNQIVLGGLSTVVECGSGASTLYLARLMRQVGGRIASVEHDERWFHIVSRAVDDEGLTECCTVVHAPLEDGWYARESVADLRRETIDCLVVDGPPAGEPGHHDARYPAGPFFAEALSPRALVMIDDIDREGERAVMDRWRADLGFDFTVYEHISLAIGSRPDAAPLHV